MERSESADLVRQMADGDEHARQVLVDRLTPVIEARIRARVRHPPPGHDMKDILQDVWVTLLKDRGQQLSQYDPARGTLEGFVGLIAEREVANLIQRTTAQKRALHLQVTSAGEDMDRQPAQQRSPGSIYETRRKAEELLAYLDARLPMKGRLVLRYLYVDGLGTSEVAEALGVKPQVVYNWSHKIRALASDFEKASA